MEMTADLSLFLNGHGALEDFDFDDIDFENIESEGDFETECVETCVGDVLDAGQDNLTPLERLEKCAFSDNGYSRQLVAHSLLNVLQEFINNGNDAIGVLETAARMSEDGEPKVRAELVEQVPNVARFLRERQTNFPAVFSRYLLPIVVRYLKDPINQVRKTSQAALFALLEEGLIPKADTETKVCPVLLDLTELNSAIDYKIEAVAIMCKLMTILDKEAVERLLLPRFCELCSDARLIQVRKACAANFGALCSIVGQDATEKLLVQKFVDLCSDSLWGIRKACAECFTAVSNSTSPEVRHTTLSPLLLRLVSDQSRCVRHAAFLSLGSFISTFSNTSSTGLVFREDVPKSTSESDSSLNSLNCSETNGCHIEATITGKAPSQDSCATPSPKHVSMFDNVDRPCIEIKKSCIVNTIWDNNLSSYYTYRSENCFDNTLAKTPSREHEGQLNTSPSSSNIPMVLHYNRNCNEMEVDENSNSFHYIEEQTMLSGQINEKMPEKENEKDEDAVKENCPISSSMCSEATSDRLVKPTDASPPEPQAPSQHQIHVNSQLAESKSSEVQSQRVSPIEVASTAEPSPALESPITPETHIEIRDGQEESCIRNVLIQDDLDHSSVASELIESVEEEGTGDSLPSRASKTTRVQNVVSQELLDHYLSMANPAHAQTIDVEIANHCVFSFPGVALALGRENWHCLKGMYETLATDAQWMVRRALAFSIHELAVFLGDQLTADDLVPVFNLFLKDLDEVRNGVLKHLYDFLKVLHADKRREYLHQLQEFMVTNNSLNWRFRYELTEQLILIVELYGHNDVYDYLRQVALNLCSDSVSEVRKISYKLVVAIVRKLHASGARDLGFTFTNELIVRFCHCPKWVGRQAFAFICQAIVEEDCMPMDQFVQHLLPSLLSLSSDPVANVRVLVAKALRQSIVGKAYFKQPDCVHSDELEKTLMTLQADKDCDVRFFAGLDPNNAPMETAPTNTKTLQTC